VVLRVVVVGLVVVVDVVRPFRRLTFTVTVEGGRGYFALQKDCAGGYPFSKGTATALIPLLQAPASAREATARTTRKDISFMLTSTRKMCLGLQLQQV
jgi:hypothetical protein